MMDPGGLMERLMEDRILAYIVGALVAAMLVLLVALRLWRGGSRDDESQPWPFFPKRPLSEVEQALYHSLVKALPEHIILAQVQLSQLLGVRKGYNFHEWYNRINRLSADFVVCGKDATVIAVIDLDNDTRDRGERQAADARKHKALSAASIRVLHWQAWSLPDAVEIRRQLLAPHTAPAPRPSNEAPLRATH